MDTTTIITDSNPSLTLPGTPASELLIDVCTGLYTVYENRIYVSLCKIGVLFFGAILTISLTPIPLNDRRPKPLKLFRFLLYRRIYFMYSL